MKKLGSAGHLWFFVLAALFVVSFFVFPEFFSSAFTYKKGDIVEDVVKEPVVPTVPPLDVMAYEAKILELANNPYIKPPEPTTKIVTDPKTGVKTTVTTPPKPLPTPLWPKKTVYPEGGAILPFNRIIAYYGNLLSTKMGVLGQYPPDEMLMRLDAEVKKWNEADPTTKAIPALHYIAVVAQGSPGLDGKYRARMPDSEIDKVMAIAAKANALVFLDIQVGFSTIQDELPRLEKYLKLPNVELGMDPEFSMKSGIRPGKVVGTYDATDINYAANYLAKIVRDNNLTPKVLVVHRYTQKMVTNSQNIQPLPEVEIVMNMDGWGGQEKKIGTYKNFIYPEPVQFTGFKLFYKNDIINSTATLLTPGQLLKLNPRPIYIQYQ